MIDALIPYIVAPEKRIEFESSLPIIGDHFTLQVFGITVALGVLIGINRAVNLFAKKKDLDEMMARDEIFWVLVFGFIISHWISVLFYFPEQAVEDPWVLAYLWNGLSSVGGFFGAFVGMQWYLRRHKQPILIYADTNIFGLLIGMCFGRAACSLVHDHPGKIVEEGTFMAVGPWPCRCPSEIADAAGCVAGGGRALPECCAVGEGLWRYDLGLIEFLVILSMTLFVYFLWDWKKAAPGRMTGLVAFVYGLTRFGLDFLREDTVSKGVGVVDLRYAGLTPAQYFALAFAAAGVWLLFIRKPKDSDYKYAKESERRKREAEGASGDEADGEADDEADAGDAAPAGGDGDPDDGGDGDPDGGADAGDDDGN